MKKICVADSSSILQNWQRPRPSPPLEEVSSPDHVHDEKPHKELTLGRRSIVPNSRYHDGGDRPLKPRLVRRCGRVDVVGSEVPGEVILNSVLKVHNKKLGHESVELLHMGDR